MLIEESLTALLRALQSASDVQDISSLLSSAARILALLANPSNITLLTSQLLATPAIWGPSTNLPTIVAVIGIFRSACYHLLRPYDTSYPPKPPGTSTTLALEEWTAAVMKGTDRASPRSKQALVLSGLLQGLQSRHYSGLSNRVQHEFVISVNLSVCIDSSRSVVTDQALVIAVSQVFDLLGVSARDALDHNLLLPMLTEAVFFSGSGIHQGYFLGTIDADVLETVGKKFDWSAKSHSYLQLQATASGPLVADLGRISRLAAFSTEHATDLITLSRLLQDLFDISRSLCVQWRQNKLSEVDASEQDLFLSDNTIRKTLPLLWRVLRSSMFSIVIILTAWTGRLLSDNLIPKEIVPPSAMQILKTLRNFYFISSHLGTDTLSQHSFVYLTAVDIISQYPKFAEALVNQLRPAQIGLIPQHPLDRCLDTYFLNTAEHFATVLNTKIADGLLLSAAMPYLGTNDERKSLEAFEAAHSVMIAVMAAPHNNDLTVSRIETYAGRLFEVFPRSLSPRQFRLAVTQLVRIASPPSVVSAQRPLLPSILLEIIRFRVETASSQPLTSLSKNGEDDAHPLSEQAALVLALIHSLPCLQLEALEDWLPAIPRLCYRVQDPVLRHVCYSGFWDVLSDGEMDLDRAVLCANWWNTGGGREMVLSGGEKVISGSMIKNIPEDEASSP
ncbi:hypothetical protein XPA_006538 [Xanthoria parietina]